MPGARRYHPADIYVTENGCDVPGESDIPLPDVLDDTFRVDFYAGYVRAAQEAVAYDAVPLRGYFAWSLLGARRPPAAEPACCAGEAAGFLGPCAAAIVTFMALAGCLPESCYLCLLSAQSSTPLAA